MTLLLGRIPSIGIFIFLLYDVLRTLIIFFLVYLPLLMAFAFIFYLLLPSNDMYSDPVTSFLKVLAMMIGELEFGNFLYDATKGAFILLCRRISLECLTNFEWTLDSCHSN